MTRKGQLLCSLAIAAAIVLLGIVAETGVFQRDGTPFHVRLESTDIRVTGAVTTTITKADVSCAKSHKNARTFAASTYRGGETHLRIQVSTSDTGVRALFWGPDLFHNPTGTGVTVDPDSRTVTLTGAPFTAPVGADTVHLTGTYRCGRYNRR